MRFIQKIMAWLDIATVYSSVFDTDKYAVSIYMAEEKDLKKICETYDSKIDSLVGAKKRISEEYNLEELGLQKKLESIDDAIKFLNVRKLQHIDKFESTKAK